ncbi:NAD(P)/FAD-dependent oxidoreductase [Streptomonospora nanhaiensis]|uniref:FAD/NAD(P)-dependent oxidoreductase n=1 Tax=Streptomonospora nanhaiensis TaxID=1323731 RepID=UPI001C99BA1F|nr:NAD(P)/FAD-dependent oxidoreductase [Streptomonospora nanhaiensis]MBX9391354.1 FAD-dependent oxidoreductase [Streptomonospora nanhaiensis]
MTQTTPAAPAARTDRVVVVGAGPAGLAAARSAAAAGAAVLVIDAEPAPGGQYLRRDALAGADDRDPATALPPGVEHRPDTVVWAIEPVPGGHRLHLRTGPADDPGRTGATVDTRALVLATGAHDRALPFPGWDLPGVYTAGAAQALAKAQRLAVGERVLLAGTGPFLLPVARSLLDAGARITAVLEAGEPVTGWLRHPGGVLAGSGKLGELASHLAALARHRVPYRPRTTVVAAHGTDAVEAATTVRLDRDWNPVPGTERRVEADAVCVGFGFTPQTELAVAAGCAMAEGFVRVDAAQATSVPGVFAAGELTGIGGAALSAAEGEVAGAAAARLVGRDPRPPLAALRRVRRGRRFAAALAAAHPVRPGWSTWLAEDTLVCRCEEVRAGELRAAARERGASAARPLKLVTRAGLGPCQGRVCGRNVAELLGDPRLADGFARRPIAAPVRLGELAAGDTADGADTPAGRR